MRRCGTWAKHAGVPLRRVGAVEGAGRLFSTSSRPAAPRRPPGHRPYPPGKRRDCLKGCKRWSRWRHVSVTTGVEGGRSARRGGGARQEGRMPTVRANDVDIYYEQQGSGEPLVLIPYLAIDQACYAFQVADYAKHYTCITVDLRGAGQTSKPDGAYTTELFADDVAAFMQAIGVERAHVTGLSLGAATGMWLAAKHPEK